MATIETTQPGGYLRPQQSSQPQVFRPRSPSSPQVLSRPTTSRRKSSSSSSIHAYEYGYSSNGGAPTSQQVILRNPRQQYSTGSLGMKPRPIHSMYSTSQPQLNLDEFEVKLRSRSHTVSSHGQRNRWSTVGVGENPDKGFHSGSIGKSYDLRLMKRSVEDLRPLPIPVAAPKVPPRRGSRLTTVPDQRNPQAEGHVKSYRETRAHSCEDLLESVSESTELKPVHIDTLQQNDHHITYERSLHKNDGEGMSQVPVQAEQRTYPAHAEASQHQSHSQQQVSPPLSLNTPHYMEQGVFSQVGNPNIPMGTKYIEATQTNRMLAVGTTEGSHSGNDNVCANEAETGLFISDYSRNADGQQVQKEEQSQSDTLFVTGSRTNENVHYPTQQLQSHSQGLSAETSVNGSIKNVSNMETQNSASPFVNKDYCYQESSQLTMLQSSLTTECIVRGTQGSVSDSAYSSDAGHSSSVSSPPPPLEVVNDANLSMTPHTLSSSPSPSPHAYCSTTGTAMISIPQNNQPYQDNNLVTAPHQPPNASPTSVQSPPGDPHSYRHRPDHAFSSQTSTPNNGVEFYHSQPQDLGASQATMLQHSSYSLTQPAATQNFTKASQRSTSLGVSTGAELQSDGISSKTKALAQAFSQWQYHDTGKRKQGTGKQNGRNESKPPVKPKPASLTKGGGLSLKRDRKKPTEGNTTEKKSGQKYVFKHSQTLLSHGRTASQVDPLTDIGMEIQYSVYTPQSQFQSKSSSSSGSTLREELTFTDDRKGFTMPGRIPDTYDYSSQMTLTGDSTLTPYSPEVNGTKTPSTPFEQYTAHPPAQSIGTGSTEAHALPQPQQGTYQQPTSSAPNYPVTHPQVHKADQPTVPNAIDTTLSNVNLPLEPSIQAPTHMKPPSPHPCLVNSFSQLPINISQGQTQSSSSVPPSNLKPSSPLAPIAEVNMESEQSVVNLLNEAEQTGMSQNYTANPALANSVSFDTSSTCSSIVSQTASDGGIVDLHATEGKSSPTVQRSSTLPSAYRRPKPYRFNPKKHLSTDLQELSGESADDQAVFTSSSMRLSDFTALNTSTFPKHVKISNPFTCTSGEVTLSQDDTLDLHFVRQTKVVVMVSSEGDEYVVPLNSANRFSLIYNPLSTGQLVQQGYHFKSVGDMMAMREMPTVVVATEAYSDPKPHSSVEAGEILVVCGIIKQAHGRLLKVNSIKHGKKFLEERCVANFSTQCDSTKLSVSEMFKASMPLPQQAVIYPPSGLQLPDCLTNLPVTLKQFRVIKSVIATPPSLLNHSPIPSTPSMVFDINLDLDIDIQECGEIPDKQMIEMRTKTQQLYGSFEPAKVIPFYSKESGNQFTTQSALLTNTDQKRKFLGIQLELPEWLGQIRMSKAKQAALQSQRESLSQSLSSQGDGASNSSHTSQTQSPQLRHGVTFIPFQSVTSFQSTIEQRMAAMEKRWKKTDEKINALTRSFTEIVQQLSKMKQPAKQKQSDSESERVNDQYVEMKLNTEDSNRALSQPITDIPDDEDTECDVAADGQLTQQHVTDFDGVKEWQKKQEKHLQ